MAFPMILAKGNIRELRRFLTFALVGVVGFVVDASVLYMGIYMGLGLRLGRVFSYLAAVTTTWALNRIFTFKAPSHRGSVVGVGALFSLSTGGRGRESGGLLPARSALARW